jgi:hypothetical protein
LSEETTSADAFAKGFRASVDVSEIFVIFSLKRKNSQNRKR